VAVDFIDLRTGKLLSVDGKPDEPGEWVPVLEAEPLYPQMVGSQVDPKDRTADGKFDRSFLSPEKAYRIGRDFLAHCIRYGFPLKLIQETFGSGARILELGCGSEIPMFRTLTMDLQAVKRSKPALYVGCDLNRVKYHPQVSGIDTHILEETNAITQRDRVPDVPFDFIFSFEVLEHMDKNPDGEAFLDGIFDYARRRPQRENKPCTVVLSTPVNNGLIAKNHIYEWRRSELRRAFESRGGRVVAEYGTFSSIADIVPVLTPAEREVWNTMAKYHSPHTMTAFFSSAHPEAARNILWHVEVAP
jgi:Methyltransferase domain